MTIIMGGVIGSLAGSLAAQNSGRTPTQQFIEDGIAGDWLHKGEKHLFDSFDGDAHVILRLKGSANRFRVSIADILLDPLAWQAVGKTRTSAEDEDGKHHLGSWWIDNWHRFIDHLTDGKTIDDALAAISQEV